MTTVGFAVPSIPPRAVVLRRRALKSIQTQTHPIAQVEVEVDHRKEGAGPTRNAAKNRLETEWTCFLDDDDELLPTHVEQLLGCARETGADVVYPWFVVCGAHGVEMPGLDPFPQWAHTPWEPDNPHIFPITTLVRTEVAQSLDFDAPLPGSMQAGEDWPWWCALQAAGAKIVHLDAVTWRWHWDPHYPNTSGVPSRW